MTVGVGMSVGAGVRVGEVVFVGVGGSVTTTACGVDFGRHADSTITIASMHEYALIISIPSRRLACSWCLAWWLCDLGGPIDPGRASDDGRWLRYSSAAVSLSSQALFGSRCVVQGLQPFVARRDEGVSHINVR